MFPKSPPQRAGTTLALVRATIGLLGLLAPDRTQQAALLPSRSDAITNIWTRFWATRALALGIGYLTADRPTRHHLIRMGLLVDATDTTFLLTMALRPDTSRRTLGWLAAITTLSTAADLTEINRPSPRHPETVHDAPYQPATPTSGSRPRPT